MSFESSSSATSRAPSSRGEIERPDDTGVLGDVVGLDAEVVGDRGVGLGAMVAGVRPGQVVERGPERRGSGVAAGGAVGPDRRSRGEALAGTGGRLLPGQFGEERVAQASASPAPPADGASAASAVSAVVSLAAGRTGSSTRDAPLASPPRSLRATQRSGS